MLPGRLQAQQRRPGGWDRCRISERLQAALAGLQELQVLRERQRALVRGALAMQCPAEGSPAQSKEQRLEATLAALKEQLEESLHLLPLRATPTLPSQCMYDACV
ncbi:UNVERIFIED_CONTAM: Dapper 2 [Gekko kuhli]